MFVYALDLGMQLQRTMLRVAHVHLGLLNRPAPAGLRTQQNAQQSYAQAQLLGGCSAQLLLLLQLPSAWLGGGGRAGVLSGQSGQSPTLQQPRTTSVYYRRKALEQLLPPVPHMFRAGMLRFRAATTTTCTSNPWGHTSHACVAARGPTRPGILASALVQVL